MAEGTYAVVWPRGRSAALRREVHSGVSTLEGKTVAFIWDYVFKGDRMWELLRADIEARYADVTFVDYPVFGNIHSGTPAEERAAVAAIPDRLLEYRVDAAIVGVGA